MSVWQDANFQVPGKFLYTIEEEGSPEVFPKESLQKRQWLARLRAACSSRAYHCYVFVERKRDDEEIFRTASLFDAAYISPEPENWLPYQLQLCLLWYTLSCSLNRIALALSPIHTNT